jgi:hypothetical protein
VQAMAPSGSGAAASSGALARLIHRHVRVLRGPQIRAADGGNLRLSWLLDLAICGESHCCAKRRSFLGIL